MGDNQKTSSATKNPLASGNNPRQSCSLSVVAGLSLIAALSDNQTCCLTDGCSRRLTFASQRTESYACASLHCRAKASRRAASRSGSTPAVGSLLSNRCHQGQPGRAHQPTRFAAVRDREPRRRHECQTRGRASQSSPKPRSGAPQAQA